MFGESVLHIVNVSDITEVYSSKWLKFMLYVFYHNKKYKILDTQKEIKISLLV